MLEMLNTDSKVFEDIFKYYYHSNCYNTIVVKFIKQECVYMCACMCMCVYIYVTTHTHIYIICIYYIHTHIIIMDENIKVSEISLKPTQENKKWMVV